MVVVVAEEAVEGTVMVLSSGPGFNRVSQDGRRPRDHVMSVWVL